MPAVETFELLPSLAQGELAETSAPELVAAVFRSRASGTLWMEPEESNEIRCFFRAGDMCGTGSFKGFQTLAHVLLANEWVDALDIDSSREEAQAKNQRHGEVLVGKGLLTHDQLRTALGAQHTANLTKILMLSRGKYDWRGSEPPPPWAREVTVDPVACLVDALEHEQHAPRREKILQWMGNSAARLSLDWPELQGRVSLGPLERRAAALLALPRRLDEFVQASRLPQTRAEAILVALLLAGGAEPQPSATPPPRAEPVRAEPVRAAQVKIAPVRAAPAPVQPEPLLEPLPEHELHPEPELLHPEPEPELMELHPDPMPALHPDPLEHSGPQPDPFASPQLQAPQARSGMDESEALKRLDSLSLDEMAASPTPEPLTPIEEPLEIDHQRAGSAAVGGNTAGAPHGREEPVFEPDGTPAEDERNRDLRKKLMARGLRNLGGAPAGRTAYDAQLKAGGGAGGKPGSRREEASLALKMGEVLLKKRDFEGAINKLRRSVDLDANGDALAALAWALVADPKGTPAIKEEAASLINRALRAPGVTARTYYVAGVLWRTKDPDSAVDAFRKALEIDPNHSDASLELRLIEQRRGKQQKTGGGVLSGLLFGKRKS